MSKFCSFGVFLSLLCSVVTYADSVVVELASDETIVLERHDVDVNIDGQLSESIWQQLSAYDEFVVIEPDTLGPTSHATRVRFFYDDKGLYVGVDVDQPKETLVSRLSGRDSRNVNRDGVALTLDTSGDGRYGYWFGVNLGDSLMDGTLLPERKFSSDWDGAWRGATHVTEAGWSAEMHIPWGSVSMPQAADVRRIGMYMSRKVAYLDQRWAWPGLPSSLPKFISSLQSLQVTGVDPKQQYSIYPFATISSDEIDNESEGRIGADFFWRPSTNFQLTGTINPDFGIVESDEVVVNLSATETFFPEKRLFFLEGQEVFVASPRADTRGNGVGNTGSPITLVNTRRIGGKVEEPQLGDGVSISDRELIQPAELKGATKLTGQYGRFRYGILGAFEKNTDLIVKEEGVERQIDVEGSDYAVARIVYEDSPGGSYRAFGVLSTAVTNETGDAVVHGLDGHYLSVDGQWKVDGQVFVSEIDDIDTGTGGFVDLEYTVRQGVRHRVGIEYFDENVDINDLGFMQRNDNLRVRSSHTRTTSGLTWARDNQFDIRGYVQKNKEGLFTGGGVFLANKMTFNNLSKITTRASFYAGSYDDLNSYGNGSYRIDDRVDLSFAWQSDTSQSVSYGFDFGYKNEHLGGDTYSAGAFLDWRPTDRFGVSVRSGYQNREGWLLHQEDKNFTTFDAEQWTPKFSVDYFFNAKQQLRVSMQWVGIKAKENAFFVVPDKPGDLMSAPKPEGASDSFSVSQYSFQARYRWEIAPLSDVFLVYTRLADQGASLGDSDFSNVFTNSYDEPLVNIFVFKIRYRLGS
ncbi:MAG: hypothetical protein ACI89U_000477 [Gammaproteobacteria bacterium]